MILILSALIGAAPTGVAHAGTWAHPREVILDALARVKNDEPIDHLYDDLNPARLDATLWRWALTDEMPRVKDRATQLLGETAYSPARFERLITEMERAIVAGEPRAYDFMVAVARMRADPEAAAAQMKERVRRGLPPSLRAHYYRARVEYDLVPTNHEADVVAAEMNGPSDEARALAFRDAFDLVGISDLGAPPVVIRAIDHLLMMAPNAQILEILAALRERPHGFAALIPVLLKIYVDHPSAPVRKAATRTLFRLRGGERWHDLEPRIEGAKDFINRTCERLLYRP